MPKELEEVKLDEVIDEFDDDKYLKDDFLFSGGSGKNERLSVMLDKKPSIAIKKKSKSVMRNKIDLIH